MFRILPASRSAAPRVREISCPCELVKAFPMPISSVSPKIRYLPLRYPITWVFAPLAYSTDRVLAPVAQHPISTWATQWFTPISGTLSARASDRAAVATVLRQGPSPGPWENAIPVYLIRFLEN